MPTSIFIPKSDSVIISNTPPLNPIQDTTLWWEPTVKVQWFWNGQYWLSSQVFYFFTAETTPGGNSAFTTCPSTFRKSLFNLFLVEHIASYRFTGVTDATNKLILTFRRISYANTQTTLVTQDTFINADLPNTDYEKLTLLNLHQDFSALNVNQYLFNRTPSGTIGLLTASQTVSYRLARK